MSLLSSPQTIQIEGQVSSGQEKTYLHIPFQVPENAARLEVKFGYSERISSQPGLTGGNTIDLGVFDERGVEFLNAGFRGWSGSERPGFFITRESASPGYLAGPLNPGLWHILLGLYKIGPQGCTYHIEISIATQAGIHATGQASLAAAAPLGLPASSPQHYRSEEQQAQWLRGELHCHSWHSDGAFSPAELVFQARARGMDFLSIADHNTTASQLEQEKMHDPGLVLMRGVEVTSFKGHFNVLGLPDWIDFRVQNPDQMESVLQRARDLGAFTSCNHPKPLGPDWDYRQITSFDSVEVWNGPWTGLNEMSLEYWSSLLAAGMRLAAVGGSDYHRSGERSGLEMRDIGAPSNWVPISGLPTAAKILDALRGGHASLSEAPSGPFLELSGRDGAYRAGDLARVAPGEKISLHIHCRDGAGSILRLLDQRSVLYEQEITCGDETIHFVMDPSASLFCRAELRYLDERMRALTNPLYFVLC